MENISNSHLHGTTYLKHFKRSMKFCLLSAKASLCFFVHSFFPEIFTEAGSNVIRQMNFDE